MKNGEEEEEDSLWHFCGYRLSTGDRSSIEKCKTMISAKRFSCYLGCV